MPRVPCTTKTVIKKGRKHCFINVYILFFVLEVINSSLNSRYTHQKKDKGSQMLLQQRFGVFMRWESVKVRKNDNSHIGVNFRCGCILYPKSTSIPDSAS